MALCLMPLFTPPPPIICCALYLSRTPFESAPSGDTSSSRFSRNLFKSQERTGKTWTRANIKGHVITVGREATYKLIGEHRSDVRTYPNIHLESLRLLSSPFPLPPSPFPLTPYHFSPPPPPTQAPQERLTRPTEFYH
jgi:hypothetical protein